MYNGFASDLSTMDAEIQSGHIGPHRFPDGNQFGKKKAGNPNHRRIHAYRAAAQARISEAKWCNLLDAMYEMALSGDVQAARFCAEYVVGKPQAIPEENDVDEDRRPLVVGPPLPVGAN